MGIVNVTPDSFSDGGVFNDHTAAIAHAIRMADDGADIIDIGGESTRPAGATYGAGAQRVDVADELARVIPVIEGVRAARPEIAISVDSMKPAVARRALAVGASVINDVSAGRFDEAMFAVAADNDVPYILMHGHDPFDSAPVADRAYGDVVAEVKMFLKERIVRARACGVRTVIADVGIGFAKGFDDNVSLLRHHAEFFELNVPMLVGASRKAFIGRMLGGIAPAERDAGSLAAHAVAVANGATIIRTHDVRSSVQFLTVLSRLIRSEPDG